MLSAAGTGGIDAATAAHALNAAKAVAAGTAERVAVRRAVGACVN